MGNLIRCGSLVFVSLLMFTSGCLTWHAEIEDRKNVYSEAAIAGAPTIVITDMSDGRKNKELVGRISALNLATKTPINIIFTNRIASKLKYAGFNIQHSEVSGSEAKSKLSAVLKSLDANLLFTGRLDHFYVESSDAVLETARGRASFRVEILDENGKSAFYKTFTGNAQRHIGLDGGPGSEKLIEQTIQAAIKALFADIEFQEFLSRARNS